MASVKLLKRKAKIKDNRKILAGVTSAYLAVMLSLYILFPGFGGYRGITAAKWIFYTLLTGAYIVVLLVCRVYLAAEQKSCPGETSSLKALTRYFFWRRAICSLLSYRRFCPPISPRRFWAADGGRGL